MAVKKGLGRGLEALFADNDRPIETPAAEEPAGGGEPMMVSVSEIEPNKEQPRSRFDEEKLEELAASVAEHGVINPLIVSPIGGGRYRIIAGERRWRAARKAGVRKVPVVVKDVSPQEIMEIALIENLQREDLNVIEEARGYQRLADEFHLTQEQMARRVGKSRPVVANALRLLTLPESVVELMEQGKISLAQGKVLLSCPRKEEIPALAGLCAEKELTVRELESMIKKLSAPPRPVKMPIDMLYYDELAKGLSETLGRKVSVLPGKKGGRIVLEYYDNDDLNALAEKINK